MPSVFRAARLRFPSGRAARIGRIIIWFMHMKKLVFALVLAFPQFILAQSGDLFVSGGPVFASNNGIGSGYTLDNGWRLGFRFGTNSEGHYGHEFGYTYNRTHLKSAGVDQGGMAIHQGGYNFLLYANRDGSRIRPFATGGGHFNNYVPPGSSAASDL